MEDSEYGSGTIHLGGPSQRTGESEYNSALYGSTGGGGDAKTGYNEGGLYTHPNVDAGSGSIGKGWDDPVGKGWTDKASFVPPDASPTSRGGGEMFPFSTQGALMMSGGSAGGGNSGLLGGSKSKSSTDNTIHQQIPPGMIDMLSNIKMPGSIGPDGEQRTARFYQAQSQMLHAMLPYFKMQQY